LSAGEKIGSITPIGNERPSGGGGVQGVVAKPAFEVDLLKRGAAHVANDKPIVAALSVDFERLYLK
jgi:hypothetical protein